MHVIFYSVMIFFHNGYQQVETTLDLHVLHWSNLNIYKGHYSKHCLKMYHMIYVLHGVVTYHSALETE